MKRSPREWLIRILILMIGLSIAHLGVTLFLLSELGSDPFNVLIQGLFRTLSSLTERSFLTHGRVHIAVSLLIILILLLTDRSYIKIGTVLCMVCGGPIIRISMRISHSRGERFIFNHLIICSSRNSSLPCKREFMLFL